MVERTPPEFDPAIKAYYDQSPEESRLAQWSPLEEARSRELILRHAPPAPAVVLDVGGAAGAYAFWLAELGYQVSLFDASPRLVDVARARNEKAKRRLMECKVADARALPHASDSADMVLLLGPLYHLVRPADRSVALSEAARVLRTGGVLMAAAISRWGSVLDGLARELLRDRNFAPIVERDLVDGNHRNPTNQLDYFTTAYFHRPEDLRREVIGAGLDVEGLYGIEGPGWILPDLPDRWKDRERRDLVIQVARMIESEPAMLGCSAHLMVVGRNSKAEYSTAASAQEIPGTP
jgi:SAM-dependent methyltransferase